MDEMTKIYQGLTDHERGLLAWQYLAKGDELERLRIESSMKPDYFVGLPSDYRRSLMAGRDLAMLYACQYWEQVAHCLALQSGCMALLSDESKPEYIHAMARFEAQERRLLAIEQAFSDTCTAHGLDAVLMRQFAGKPFYQVATPNLEPDQDYLDGMRDIFEDALR